MKRILVLAPVLAAVALSCQKEPEVVNVTAVTLNSTSFLLTEGETASLTATVSPDNADNKKVIWSSSDGSVASVSNGTVTALKAGTADITVTTDDGGKTATCSVTVKARTIDVADVVLTPSTLTLTEGDSETLTATVKPDNATNRNVTWASSDNTVATVEDGKVTAVKAGEAKITVTTEDGGKTASCSVTVKAKSYDVTGVSLNASSMTILVGNSETLIVKISPDDAANKNVTWSSSDATVASVSSDGVVKGIESGQTTITVKTEDRGYTATCTVTVVEISAYVSAHFMNLSGGMGYSSMGWEISPGTNLGLALRNSSSSTIELKKLRLYCSVYGTRSEWTLNTSLQGGKIISYTVTLRTVMYSPIVEFDYEFNGKTYTAKKQFSGSLGLNSVSAGAEDSHIRSEHLTDNWQEIEK